MKKPLILIFLIFTSYFLIFGQSQVIFNKSNNESVVMRYTQNQNLNLNAMLQTLANGNGVNVNSVNITFKYEENLKILKRAQELNFLVSLGKFNFQTGVSYKDFDVSDFFIPNNISYKLNWKRGNTVLNTYNFNNVSMEGGKNVTIADMIVNDSLNGSNYSIVTNNSIFNFSEKGKKDFIEYASFIEDYYKESTIARGQLNRINDINPDKDYLSHMPDLNKLFEYRDLAQNSLNYALNVETKPFYKNLKLGQNDPKNLRELIKKIDNKSKVLHRNCDELIKNLHLVYFDRGMEMLAKNSPAEADRFFQKSIEIKPDFAAPHLQIAIINYNSGYVDKALNILYKVKDMQADPQTKTQIIDFAEGMYNDFILEARDLNRRNNFDGALATLDRAAGICRDFAQIMCKQEMDIEYSRAINGKYFMILSDIDMEIAKGRLSDAERIINIAGDYRQRNISFIPSDRDLGLRISNLYFGYIDRGNSYNNQTYFDKALLEFNEAERICNTYKEINCTVELIQGISNSRNGIYKSLLISAKNHNSARNYEQADKDINDAISYRAQYTLNKDTDEDNILISIKQGMYNDYVSRGVQFQNSGNYGNALNLYDKAVELKKSFAINRNPNLEKYINTTAKSFILQKEKDGDYAVTTNNLPQARTLFTEMRDLQTKYQLVGDKDADKSINNLKDKIFKQECINSQNDFDNHYAAALSSMNKKNYIEADNYLSKALGVSTQFTQCMIDTRAVNNSKVKIAPAVKFQNNISETERLINSNNFSKAMQLYEETYNYFNMMKISSFGLQCDNLFDFVQKQPSEFVNYSIGYFTSKELYDEAIKSISTLKFRNYKVGRTKSAQTDLGMQMAIRDFKSNSSSDPYVNMASYTKGDKYYKYFMKAYKKQWKKLD